MPSTLRLALFDCDGTLVDSQHSIVAAMTAAFEAFGLEPPDAMQTRRVIGLSLDEAIARLMPEEGCGYAPHQLAEVYKETFRANRIGGVHDDPLFPGVVEALNALEGADVLLGIVTGKSRRGLDAVLERYRLRDRFVTLQTADTGPGKPDPSMVLRALNETGAERRDTVIVGDTAFDVLMARAAGAHSIDVSWGYHHPAELLEAGADRLVDDYDGIPLAVMELLDSQEPQQPWPAAHGEPI
jgi:phosphoglycolate phosphatase